VDGLRWVAPTTLLVSLMEMDGEDETEGGQVAAMQWDSWAGQPGVDPQGLTTTRVGFNTLGVSCKETLSSVCNQAIIYFLAPLRLHSCVMAAACPGTGSSACCSVFWRCPCAS
jgi:hypothetical protein